MGWADYDRAQELEKERDSLRQQLAEAQSDSKMYDEIQRLRAVIISDHGTLRLKQEQIVQLETQLAEAQADCKEADETAVKAAWAIAEKSVTQQERITALETQLAEAKAEILSACQALADEQAETERLETALRQCIDVMTHHGIAIGAGGTVERAKQALTPDAPTG